VEEEERGSKRKKQEGKGIKKRPKQGERRG